MIQKLKQLFRPRNARTPASVPHGQRVYAIGDVHGRLDLLTAIAAAIEADDAARKPSRTTVLLLGDLIDRGPESAGVLEMVRNWANSRKLRILSGNHEEMFLSSFYSLKAFKSYTKFGGRETILSYGVDPEQFLASDPEEAQQIMIDTVPLEDREFIYHFEKLVAIGDYVFVHAGIRPNASLSQQTGWDCRWIREPFLDHRGDLGCVVVHGHTITEDVAILRHRIGIDTGAFMSGRLTALGLEGHSRWLIQTDKNRGAVASRVPGSL